ncbi:MAG: hypothetical protein Q9213_005997 [Squamulea squamosa]
MPRIPGMDCLDIDLPNVGSVEMIRDQVLERLATSNLKAIEAYIAHHPDDEGAKVVQLNSSLILSQIKLGKNLSWPPAVIPDLDLQVPDFHDHLFETRGIRDHMVIKRAPAAPSLDSSPLNDRTIFTLLVLGIVIGLVVDFQLHSLQSFLYRALHG